MNAWLCDCLPNRWEVLAAIETFIAKSLPSASFSILGQTGLLGQVKAVLLTLASVRHFVYDLLENR